MGPQEYKLDVPPYVVSQFIHKVYPTVWCVACWVSDTQFHCYLPRTELQHLDYLCWHLSYS